MTLREKRLQLLHGHMLSVPAKRISLWSYGIQWLTGVGHDQPCGAIGCLLGHSQTIPEYREWELAQYGNHSTDFMETKERMLKWLGYTLDGHGNSPMCGESTLFAPGPSGEAGRRVALKRLEELIAQEQEVTA